MRDAIPTDSDLMPWARAEDIARMQTTVYTMCGGGLLGRLAAEQPADFYIDDRCGRLPFSRRTIENAVAILARCATLAGLNPHALTGVTTYRTHNLGAF